MSERKTGLSYLDRPTFSFKKENLSAWTGWILGLLIVSCIGLIYLVLAASYLLMAYHPSAAKPASLESPISSSPAVLASAGQGDQLESDNDEDTAGAKFITFNNANHNYYGVQNSNAGQLLIISGWLVNSYPEARSFIRLRGRLLDINEASLAERLFYAGNIIPDDELHTLSADEIKARLSIEGGAAGMNIDVPAGAEIPFMVVFDQLPDGMAEYSIEAVSSSPALGQ